MIGSITATRLNIRAQPNISSRKLGELSKGALINILGARNEWLEIQYQNTPGFVFNDYVALQEREPAQNGVITTNLLNVRDRPATNGVILGGLTRGSKVEVLAQHGGWLEIPFLQGTAFISGTYVDLYAQETIQHGVVTASLLNVRLSPQSGARVIGQLSENSTVVVASTIGDWCEIPFNNGMGYIASRYVELRPEADESAPRPISTTLNDGDEEDDGARVVQADREAGVALAPVNQLLVAGTAEERKVAATWNRFGGLLVALSDEKEIDVGCAVAVLCVESSGKGFEPGNQGLMIIRFENHKFWKYWGKSAPDRFRQHFSYQSGKAWKGHQWRKKPADEWRTFHGSQRAEWEVLNFARSIDNSAALKSISMGAPQIMGFNYEREYRITDSWFVWLYVTRDGAATATTRF